MFYSKSVKVFNLFEWNVIVCIADSTCTYVMLGGWCPENFPTLAVFTLSGCAQEGFLFVRVRVCVWGGGAQ